MIEAPEFSVYGAFAALVVLGIIFFIMRKKKLKG